MGTASPAKKRKRSKVLDNEQTLLAKEDEVLEADSPGQKPAKKRRKSKQNDSLVEDTPKVDKKKTRQNTTGSVDNEQTLPAKEDEVLKADSPEKKSAKKRGRKSKQNDSLVEDTPKADKKQTDSSGSDIAVTKKKSKTPKRKLTDEENGSNSSEAKTPESKKKDGKKMKSEGEESKQNGKDEAVGKKKKKEKNKDKKKAPAFGVVDSELLAKSGGGNHENKRSPINCALDYLHLWKTSRKTWKFNKRFQTLLVKAIYNPVIISDEDFETMLLYFEQCMGMTREKLKTDAMELVKESDDHLGQEIDADMERRARALLQMLG